MMIASSEKGSGEPERRAGISGEREFPGKAAG